jgi:hypothetical protein
VESAYGTRRRGTYAAHHNQQKDHYLTTDLIKKGTPKNEQTNPFLNPEKSPQVFACQEINPTKSGRTFNAKYFDFERKTNGGFPRRLSFRKSR